MKKIFSIVLMLTLVLTLCSCSGNAKDGTYIQVDDVKTLSSRIGFDITLPATAGSISCFVADEFIAEVNFAYNGVMYKYRASKLLGGKELHGVTDRLGDASVLTIDDRADVSVYILKSEARLATWYAEGTNYSLYTEKNVSDDTITELCDLLLS